MNKLLLVPVIYLLMLGCHQERRIVEGIKIHRSTTFQNDVYTVSAPDSIDKTVINISGNDIEIDFQNAILESNLFKLAPDTYTGFGILIENGDSITLKNLTIRGFKVAIMARNVNHLKFENIDASYNYRQKLKSAREKEDPEDWMSYHSNENDEWLRYGSAFYLKDCDSMTVVGCMVSQGQCALMMMQCNDGLIYNNNFSFNSAIGIGLYRSKRNQIMHNKLDWNVRGYSQGIYRRGQDSAGILVYEQSSDNIIAYNSATHSGDGFFLWGGNTYIRTGEGGANGNLIYRNDFSHAPTNCLEITFSSNRVIENILNDCRYGIWAGYSHDTEIANNQIKDNEFGVAFEHGQNNLISSNYFNNDRLGIQLWERTSQPQEWKFVNYRNIDSKNYEIIGNLFDSVEIPFHISHTDSTLISGNHLRDYTDLLAGNENTELQIQNSILDQAEMAKQISTDLFTPADQSLVPRLTQGRSAFLPDGHPRGVEYIFVNEWGPYNFEYPAVFLIAEKEGVMNFSAFGPEGNWKITKSEGFKSINPKTGSFPNSIRAEKMPGAEQLVLELQFIGQSFVDQFGNKNEKGNTYAFGWNLLEDE